MAGLGDPAIGSPAIWIGSWGRVSIEHQERSPFTFVSEH